MRIYLLGAAPVVVLAMLTACGETATPEKGNAAAAAS